MSQKEYRGEGRRPAQSRNGHGGRRVAPSHPEGGRHSAPRRRKERLGGWGVLLYVTFVLGVSALLAGVGWAWANGALALNKPVLTTVVKIDGGDTVDQVADKLEEQGLIEYKMVFKLLCPLIHTSGKAGEEGAKVIPGTYELNTDVDCRALVSSTGSSSANRTTITVTTSEGVVEARILAPLRERGVSTVEQLGEAAANYDFEFSFFKSVVPSGSPKRPEGYLLPDAYEFHTGEEPVSVLNKMVPRFDEIFVDEMHQEAQNGGRTIQDVVTVASIIEKETNGFDQAKIASVIYNHLDNPTSETAGCLNISATILYVIGDTEVDLNADAPYNTRTHKGLTPTAIASLDVDALKAVVYPNSTGYCFYVLRNDGKHHFSAVHREQQSLIASQERYQNGWEND